MSRKRTANISLITPNMTTQLDCRRRLSYDLGHTPNTVLADKPDFAIQPCDLAVSAHFGERAVKRFVRETKLCSEILESARQGDGSLPSADIGRQIVANAIPCGGNAAPLKANS